MGLELATHVVKWARNWVSKLHFLGAHPALELSSYTSFPNKISLSQSDYLRRRDQDCLTKILYIHTLPTLQGQLSGTRTL